MTKIRLSCSNTLNKYNQPTGFEIKSDKTTLVNWNNGEHYDLRYKCPLCNVIELYSLYETIHKEQVEELKGYGIKVQRISSPVLETPNQSDAKIDHDYVIDFHEQITSCDVASTLASELKPD